MNAPVIRPTIWLFVLMVSLVFVSSCRRKTREVDMENSLVIGDNATNSLLEVSGIDPLTGGTVTIGSDSVPAGTVVSVEGTAVPARLSSFAGEVQGGAIRVNITDKDGNEVVAFKPVLVTLPKDSVPADAVVLQIENSKEGKEVQKFQPIPVTPEVLADPVGRALKENLGLIKETTDTTNETLKNTCGVTDADEKIKTVGKVDASSALTLIDDEPITINDHPLLGRTVVTALTSSASFVITTQKSLQLLGDESNEIKPLALRFDSESRSLAPPIKLLSLTPQLNTNTSFPGKYSHILLGKLSLSSDYLKLLTILYENKYVVKTSEEALRNEYLYYLASSIRHVVSSSKASTSQIYELYAYINFTLRHKTTQDTNSRCFGKIYLFPPLRDRESSIYSHYNPLSNPYTQDDFFSESGETSYSCTFSSTGGVGWDYMRNVELSDYEVIDGRVSLMTRGGDQFTSAPAEYYKRRIYDAMGFNPIKPTPANTITPEPLPQLDETHGKEQVKDVKNVTPECKLISSPPAALALAEEDLGVYVRSGRTGIFPAEGSVSLPSTVSFTASTMEVTQTGSTSVTLNIKEVGNKTDNVIYSLYYVEGTFEENDVPAFIVRQANVSSSTVSPGTVVVENLKPQTKYSFVVIASDRTSGHFTAYTPIEQTTGAAPISVGSMSISSVGDTSFTLTLTAASGGAGSLTYKIYKIKGAFSASTASAIQTEGSLVTTLTSISSAVTVSDLSAGTSYQVAVVVSDSAGSSAIVSPVTQVTTGLGAGVISASNVSSTSFDLSIAAPTNGTAPYDYMVYVKTSAYSASTIAAVESEGVIQTSDVTNGAAQISVPFLSANTKYWVAVIVQDGASKKALSEVITVQTSP